MSTYTGKYSGSGKAPVPARGSYCEDDAQDTGDQKQPPFTDYAGGRSAKNNKALERFLHGNDPNPTPKASS
jgi:hypothetical protein